MGVPEDKICIVPNGIELADFNELPIKGEFRTKFQIDASEKIILYLGRIHRIKGIDLLIRAFADLLIHCNNVKLVIVGADDGFMQDVLREIEYFNLKNNIIFTGPLYGREKLMAFIDADVYVLPSVYETFPNTILEAYACGTPVITTDRCAISDLVKLAGLVVKYDKNELKDALRMLLDDELARSEYSKEGKALVRDKFNIEEITSRLELIYNKLI